MQAIDHYSQEQGISELQYLEALLHGFAVDIYSNAHNKLNEHWYISSISETFSNFSGDQGYQRMDMLVWKNDLQLIVSCSEIGKLQDLEIGNPKLAIVKFWGILFLKGSHNTLRLQP